MSTSQSFKDNDLSVPHQGWAILLVSILGLFLETLFIRWIGTEIRIFAYLQNTVLVVCFLGLGIGMFTAAKKIEIRQSLLPLAVLMIVMAVPLARLAVGNISEMLSTTGDLLIWRPGEETNTVRRVIFMLTGLALTYGVMALTVDIFVPLGRILGRLMNAHSRPIWAYSINIFGSMVGTWAFVLLSFSYQPPFVWFLVAAAFLSVLLLWSTRDRSLNFAWLALILILSWFAGRVPDAHEVIWSPYQKLVVRDPQPGLFGDIQIDVNNAGYQAMTDLSEARVAADPGRFPPEFRGLSQYDIPLLLHPSPGSILIVGAGSGNDAAGALRHNVQSVTAVEIDPAIIEIGQRLHPEAPYASANVKVVNDDARSFFATTHETYDVIIFGLLDSHTTTALTNARLDHYVYTKESIAQAASRLSEGGVMVLTFEAQKPFIADRIRSVLQDIFNQPPIAVRIPNNSYGWGGVMFVTGDLETVRSQLAKNPALRQYFDALQREYPLHFSNTTRITTDDWPYIYLEAPGVPVLYYLLIGLMIVLFYRSSKKWEAGSTITVPDRTFWHFFFLGAAFLLLEVQNISKASVVLGNTWQVNAVIITSVLAMALLANWIVHRFPKLPVVPVYIVLIGISLSLYFVDLARFGFLPYTTKAIVVGSLTSLPMVFSGMIFTRSFAEITDRSNALGANLIGALVGALLQSITFVTGIKALLLVVAVLYFLSFLALPSRSSLKEVVRAGLAE